MLSRSSIYTLLYNTSSIVLLVLRQQQWLYRNRLGLLLMRELDRIGNLPEDILVFVSLNL
jgi:hypothetical protein